VRRPGRERPRGTGGHRGGPAAEADLCAPGRDRAVHPDFFALLDAAGDRDHLRQHFLSRHRRAAQSAEGPTSTGEKEWVHYVSGIYGACLREVSPEAMVAKEQLIWRIETLTAQPRPDDDSWAAQLREAVDALDSIERPFTDYDRQRWGGTSRDSHITDVRETYL